MSVLKELIKHDKKIFKDLRKNFDSEDLLEEEVLFLGLDEVGRGCLAGPVATAAYATLGPWKYKSKDKNLDYLNDSKKVNAKYRADLCRALKTHPQTLWAIDFQAAELIDRIGIVNCIWNSMTENVYDLLNGILKNPQIKFPRAVFVLVDGTKTITGLEFNLMAEYGQHGLEFVEQTNIVKGDSKSALIAGASNIAKDIRDKYMHELAADFPEYLWQTNVGYGTAKHIAAIEAKGPCQYHRMSFLENILNQVNTTIPA